MSLYFLSIHSPIYCALDRYHERTTRRKNGSRIGSTQWCICWGFEAMPTDDECFCYKELAELNQKFDESGLLFLPYSFLNARSLSSEMLKC